MTEGAYFEQFAGDYRDTEPSRSDICPVCGGSRVWPVEVVFTDTGVIGEIRCEDRKCNAHYYWDTGLQWVKMPV